MFAQQTTDTVEAVDPAVAKAACPAVFIAAGAGITALLPVAAEQAAAHPETPIVVIHAFPGADEPPPAGELEALADGGADVHVSAEITPALLHELMPHTPFNVYLGGPAEFTEDVRQQLSDMGVPAEDIRDQSQNQARSGGVSPGVPQKQQAQSVPSL